MELRSGTDALLTMADGQRIYTLFIEENSEGNFDVRIEDGWYNEYSKDGRAICSGIVRKTDGTEEVVRGRDIIDIRWLKPGEIAAKDFWKKAENQPHCVV